MYTRCPSCNATFRVTATLLQMAEGDVRCGSCGIVFNALQTLVDDWTRTDRTLPEVPAVPSGGNPQAGSPAATGNDGRSGTVPETLEFNVPETEWQRFFITPADSPAPRRSEPAVPEDLTHDESAEGDHERSSGDDARVTQAETFDEPSPAAGVAEVDPQRIEPTPRRSLEEETADTDTWKAFLLEAEQEPDEHEEPEPALDIEDEEDNEPLFVVSDENLRLAEVLIRHPPAAGMVPVAGDAADDAPHDDRDAIAVAEPEPEPAGDDVESDEPRDRPATGVSWRELDADLADATPGQSAAAGTVLDWGPPPSFTERTARPPAHTLRWLALSVVAALALAAQIVHYARDALAADPRYGAVVRDLYGRLGLPLHPAWPLDSYEIRGAKAIAENSAPGALDIVAEIAVTGAQGVGLPMVRVVLRDRWSNAVASGIFDSTHYLAESATRDKVYAPGSLIPVQISLKDPGSAAQGYELDVCVPNRQTGLQCRSARDPFRR